jgi:hypothetical protein
MDMKGICHGLIYYIIYGWSPDCKLQNIKLDGQIITNGLEEFGKRLSLHASSHYPVIRLNKLSSQSYETEP